jgi:hypothetical protein
MSRAFRSNCRFQNRLRCGSLPDLILAECSDRILKVLFPISFFVKPMVTVKLR